MLRPAMDEALIYVSIISGLFTLAAISLLNHNWFKKELFKTQNLSIKKKNDLQLKKFAKELGLNSSNKAPPVAGSNNILELLNQLNPETLNAIKGLLGGAPPLLEGETSEGEPDTLNQVIEMANNPLVKTFINAASNKLKENAPEGGAGNDAGWI